MSGAEKLKCIITNYFHTYCHTSAGGFEGSIPVTGDGGGGACMRPKNFRNKNMLLYINIGYAPEMKPTIKLTGWKALCLCPHERDYQLSILKTIEIHHCCDIQLD
jgi:hypothetical protein